MGNLLNVSTPSPGPHLCYQNNPFYKWCQYPIYNISTINNAIQAIEYNSQLYILKSDFTLWTAHDTLFPSPFTQITIPYSIIQFSIYDKVMICVTSTNQLFSSSIDQGSPLSTPEPVLSASLYKTSISIVTTSNKLFIKDNSTYPWNAISNGIKKAQQWDKMFIAMDINNSLQYTIYNNCPGGYSWRSFQTSLDSPIYTTAIDFSLFANNIAILTPTNQVVLGWFDPVSLLITWYPVTTISSPVNKISLYNGLLTIIDMSGNVGIMDYMSTKLNPLNIDTYTYTYSNSSCLIAPRKSIVDAGWGNNYPFFLVDKGWYDIVGQGVKNDYCRFVGGYARDNLACILSKDKINSTSKFNETNNYSTTYKGQNVLDIAKLQFIPPFPVYSTPQPITSDGFYWYETSDPKREPVRLFTKVNLADGRNWCRVFSSPFASSATVNEVGKNIPFKGFLIQPSDGSFQIYSYFSTPQLFNTRNLTALTTGGNNPGFAVYIGYAGGHGFYNPTLQTPCKWSNSVGMIGAGIDATNCGSFPNALKWGTGQSGTPICNMVPPGTVWETWITF
jgi:hypothetical protein